LWHNIQLKDLDGGLGKMSPEIYSKKVGEKRGD
jgi:hypothetical protein